MNINHIDPDLLCVCIIMQGLLSSGHFTDMFPEPDEDEPHVKGFDYGDSWQKGDGYARYKKYAVVQAMSLFCEAKEALEFHREELKAEQEFIRMEEMDQQIREHLRKSNSQP